MMDLDGISDPTSYLIDPHDNPYFPSPVSTTFDLSTAVIAAALLRRVCGLCCNFRSFRAFWHATVTDTHARTYAIALWVCFQGSVYFLTPTDCALGVNMVVRDRAAFVTRALPGLPPGMHPRPTRQCDGLSDNKARPGFVLRCFSLASVVSI